MTYVIRRYLYVPNVEYYFLHAQQPVKYFRTILRAWQNSECFQTR